MILAKKDKNNFLNNSFAVYGLGATGTSVLRYFKKNNISNYYIWDDDKKVRNNYKINKNDYQKIFKEKLDKVNFIVVSPGINIEKTQFKKNLKKNKHKIITDLDIFYIQNPKLKSIVVTGTNGKSTTCKIIQHLLAKINNNILLGGNIGKPILDLNFKKNSLVIIEASSFQLSYSRYIKAKYAIILNITKDHLDWHKNKSHYIDAKFNIFRNQKKNDFAFLNNNNLIRIFKKKKFIGSLTVVSNKKYSFIKKKINNPYLKSKTNDENMSFAYDVVKKFSISDAQIINAASTFKGLSHRHEIIYKKKYITCINDSKATSFEAAKHALMSNTNIYWILGGLPKKGDLFNFQKIKNNILKGYIIGKNINFYKKQLNKKIDFVVSKTLKNALKQIIRSKEINDKKNKIILFSPAGASFDQYKNFEERGNSFKKLIKLYARKYF